MRGVFCTILALAASLAWGAPLRVAVAPAPGLSDNAPLTDAARFDAAMALFLRDQLARTEGVAVVDDPWSRALFAEYASPKWVDPEPAFLAAFTRHAPVDAVVDFQHGNTWTCRVRSAQGAAAVSIPLVPGAPVLKALPAVSEFLARELALPPGSAEAWIAAAGTNAGAFEAARLSRRLNTAWIVNRGDGRMNLLRPHLGALPGNPALASAVLDAAAQFTLDTRKPEQADSGLQAARMAIPQLLDTPSEPEVRAFLRTSKLARDRFEKDLLELAEPLLRDELEDIVDLAGEGKTDPVPAGGTFSGIAATLAQPSRGQRLAAVRCLGALRSPAADAFLARAAAAKGDIAAAAAAARSLAAAEPDPVTSRLPPAGAPAGAWLEALRDVESPVVIATLRAASLPADDPSIRARLEELANDPYAPVTEAARAALGARRPAGGEEAVRFDLAVEHPWVRLQTLDRLATNAAGWAATLLSGAAANRDAHVRARALRLLAKRDPAAAAAASAAALADPHRWVRWHAAATLADTAGQAQAGPLGEFLKKEQDPAVRLYLADALARAQGKPPLSQPPPVHRLDPARNRSLGCGYGPNVEESPLQGYYCLDTKITDAARRAHASGKLFLCRANATSKNAGLIALDAFERDRFWLGLETELDGLDAIDGLVIGEESMGCPPRSLWTAGWRLFCRDAGLDPARVQGDVAALAPLEAAAYRNWERTMAVEGFNYLYDFIKLRYGKLRPGFQVATFLVNEEGPNPADRRWKFDIAGGYNYQASNRDQYAAIRRFRTVWPDRPVVWLALANGSIGLELLKVDTRFPTSAVPTRALRSYADAVSAWLAGADTGWFNSWLFVGKDAKGLSNPGVWVFAEDFSPANDTVLRRGIDFSFAGVADARREEERLGKAPAAPTLDLDKAGAEDLELVDPQAAREKIEKAVQAEKEPMRLGYHLEQKFYFDCARVMAGLPRPPAEFDVLLAGPRDKGAAFNLFAGFDYLNPVTALAEQDLSKYRLIAISGSGKTLLTDATLAAVEGWLRTAKGLLVVHGGLSPDNAAEDPAPGDLDGKLARDWPWERDAIIGTNGGVEVAAQADRMGPDLVLWRLPGDAGAVLFDGGASADFLAAAINRLHAERGLGRPVADVPGYQAGRAAGITAWTTAGGTGRTQAVAGVDFLSGEPAPAVGPGRNAALVAAAWAGPYVVATNGVTVLCERIPEAVEAVPGGVRIRGGGLLRAGSETGAVKALPDPAVPAVADGDTVRWIALGREPGMAPAEAGPTGARVVFVRGSGVVTFHR